MSSKDKILENIKKNNLVKDVKLPSFENFGIKYENKFETFSLMLESVGGKALIVNKEDFDETIKALYPNEKIIASNVPFCNIGNFESNNFSNASDLKDIDLAIVKGKFAVAENGAVWIQDEDNKHRALYFIAQNIVIVVDEKELVNNMHEAYEKLDFEDSKYGVFVSGPSKTADIEQSLVIGAHGPKSGYVIFVITPPTK